MGQLAVVTGATGGLGLEDAQGLARLGMEVVMAGRNPAKESTAVERVRREVPGAVVRFAMLDLASLASVQAFAEGMLTEGRPVDLLINNAGVMALPSRVLTADGFEMQFGTNHLGHFALTGRLLPLLVRGRARVVQVSSLAHRNGRIDFANLQGEKSYSAWGAYQQSKLANLLFAFELQRRSNEHGWGLMSVAAHPGVAATELFRGNGIWSRMVGLLRYLGQGAAEGALPTLFAGTSNEVAPKGYYGPNGFHEMRGAVAPAQVAPQVRDEVVARRLWAVSEELTGVQWGA